MNVSLGLDWLVARDWLIVNDRRIALDMAFIKGPLQSLGHA